MRAQAAGVGSDSEGLRGDDDAFEDLEAGATADPVQAAVVALTSIVKELAKNKQEAARAPTLETALDRAEGSSASSGLLEGSSASRSKAAAYRILRESLTKRPEQIYASIEANLSEDLLNRRAGPLAGTAATARSWFEFRSRLGYYIGWTLGSIWDALREDKVASPKPGPAAVAA